MRGKRRIDKLKKLRTGEPYLVECPNCHVSARELCMVIGGGPRHEPHPERQAAADALVERNAARRFA